MFGPSPWVESVHLDKDLERAWTQAAGEDSEGEERPPALRGTSGASDGNIQLELERLRARSVAINSEGDGAAE